MSSFNIKNDLTWRDFLIRTALIVATTAIIVWLMPRNTQDNFKIERGKPWAYNELNAPFDFPIYKSDEAVKGMVGTDEDLRLTQSALLIFLTVLILSLFLMTVMIHRRTHNYLLTFCLVFSAGTLAAIERGNIILIAFLLTFYFVEHYNDESRLKSELALLALAAAFGIKLYPCIFGLLLLKDRKFAAAGRCILYAVLFTVLPTFVFEGPRILIPWFQYATGIGASSTGGNSTTDGNASAIPLSLIIFLILGLILIVSFYIRQKGKPVICKLSTSMLLFIITYLALLIGGTSSYNLVFFIIPFLKFLKEETMLRKYNSIEYLIYLVCLLPVGINQITPLFFAFYIIGCVYRIHIENKTVSSE